jgi:hypothetical protein
MFVYELSADGRKVVFAAGELSANVWGFMCPPNPALNTDAEPLQRAG